MWAELKLVQPPEDLLWVHIKSLRAALEALLGAGQLAGAQLGILSSFADMVALVSCPGMCFSAQPVSALQLFPSLCHAGWPFGVTCSKGHRRGAWQRSLSSRPCPVHWTALRGP